MGTADKLGTYYEEAQDSLQSGKYMFNTSIIKELKMYLTQINKIVSVAGDGTQLFLLAMGTPPAPPPELSLPELLDAYRDKTEIPLSITFLTKDASS